MEIQGRTHKLYDVDSYIEYFTAEVAAYTEMFDKQGKLQAVVVLDQTAFFPEGGGQKADVGWISGFFVCDVQEKEGIVYHMIPLLEKSHKDIIKDIFTIGLKVEGKINWEKRFSNMQQHSGEHIVSGLILEKFGFQNVGFHLGTELVTLDFNGVLSIENLREIEKRANSAVFENLEIDTKYFDKQALETIEYRSKKELQGAVRIVTIPGYDCCACCAPHVKRTGEIGIIKLTGIQNYKGGVRISMLCGFRALEYANNLEQQVSEISVLLSSKPEEVSLSTAKLKKEAVELKYLVTGLQNNIITYKAAEFETGQFNACLFEKEIPMNSLRLYANQLKEKVIGVIAVFSGTDEKGYQYLICAESTDVRSYAKLINQQCNGQGGGTQQMVQGYVNADSSKIACVLQKEGVFRVYNLIKDIPR